MLIFRGVFTLKQHLLSPKKVSVVADLFGWKHTVDGRNPAPVDR